MSRQPASPVAHVGGRPIVLPRLSRVMPAVPRPQPARPVTRETAVPRTPSRRPAPRWRMADTAFRLTSLAFALSVLAITGAIAVELFVRSAPARRAFGWSFLWTSVWDPVFSKFGALPFIYGTLATTAIAGRRCHPGDRSDTIFGLPRSWRFFSCGRRHREVSRFQVVTE